MEAVNLSRGPNCKFVPTGFLLEYGRAEGQERSKALLLPHMGEINLEHVLGARPRHLT